MAVLFPPTPVTVANTTQLAYELHLTNFARDTFTLQNVQVIDAASKAVIAEFSGAALEAILGRPESGQPTSESRVVTPGRRTIVYFNLPVDIAHIPKALVHRVEFSVMTNKERKHVAVDGGQVEINKAPLPTLGPPLRGGPWVAVYNPSWKRGHRRVFYAFDGQARIQGRFAIDWMKAPEQQNVTPDSNNQTTNADGLGADALAVADAVVVAVRDSVAKPKNCADHTSLPPEDHAGNFVVLQLGNSRYAFYEHLQPGIPVQPGDRIRRGQVIGSLGCTGLATRPHLHFHIGNTHSPFSEGLPYLQADTQVLGGYDSMADFRAGVPWQKHSSENDALPDAFFPTPMMVVQFPEG